MAITANFYGRTAAGEDVYEYTMTNTNGMRVHVLEYGCAIARVLVPDKSGALRDVVLGYDTLEQYEAGTSSFGAFVGRYANRLENAEFTLDGKTYSLTANDGKNHLHGTYGKRVFRGEIKGDRLELKLHSPDGEEGFPGALDICVAYTLTEANALVLEYNAVCDAHTILNFTNHSYFNLNGHDSGSIEAHTLQINAESFTEGNAETCPTGRILPVEDTVMDFRTAKPIGKDLYAQDAQIQMAHGYDHNFVLDKPLGALARVATAASAESGITMETYTTQPGMQLYTGNFLTAELPGKGGAQYAPYGAFCLETQHYPCTPSHAGFPSVELSPDEEYNETTIYKFITEERA